MENALDTMDEVNTPTMISVPEGVNSVEGAGNESQNDDIGSDEKARNDPATTSKARSGLGSSYGTPTLVSSFGDFPRPGSQLGPFFSLGRLGKGTFCSIHKCISLAPEEPRLVAAKVELTDFVNSGVLDGEATMLHHLDTALAPRTVPKYVGHFKSDEAAAIVMEYLPGNDMHHLREASGRRRLAVRDAVYLTADVMLPLLRNMHEIGVVHRDVKPSNCVRYKDKEFCMVDFGLSKNVLVPFDSPFADAQHVWKSQANNGDESSQLYMRKERPKAEFRGTSMYASVRVHQLKDYARRDDMWSLLYVFCDLVSGGLPWMSLAANRDRTGCQEMKEAIHGLKDGGMTDETEKMLMGDEYFVAKYKRDIAEKKGDQNLPDVPPPLSMHQDARKVQLLRTAFEHVANLSFADEPDYGLLKRCLHGFLDDHANQADSLPEIDWQKPAVSETNESKKRKRSSNWKGVVAWQMGGLDPLVLADEALWQGAEAEHAEEAINVSGKLFGDAADIARLPVEFQYRVAQMEYNSKKSSTIPKNIALNDWMQCAVPLVYATWDSKTFEAGGHRRSTDSHRRDLYLKLVDKCLKCAARFGYFHDRSCLFETETINSATGRRRQIEYIMEESKPSPGDELVAISRVLHGLRSAKQAESRKSSAPPPALSFGSGMEQ